MDKEIVIYTYGVWDLMHHGHYNLLKQAREMGTRLVVGVMSDEIMKRDKRLPIMNMHERGQLLEHCKYVDEVVLNAPDPPDIDEKFLDKYKINYVVHSFSDSELWKISKEYSYLISIGKFKQLKRTEGISTTDLIERARKRNLYVPEYTNRDIYTFIEKYENTSKSYATLFNRNFVRAKDVYVWDIDGKKYVDCLNGFGVNIFGHNPDCLQNTLREYINTNPLWQAIDLFTPEHVDFVEALFKLLPAELINYRICFTGPTGSEANEMAIKMARKTTGRKGIFAFTGCYHGSTVGTNTLTGNKHDQSFGSLSHTYHMPFPRTNSDDCPFNKGGEESINLSLCYIERLLSDPKGGTDIPAAMIIEPCQSDGGIIPAPKRFLEGLYALCIKYDILFISDEVQTGFGKTGNLFGYQMAKIKPHIITCSKSWGGGLPLAFVLYDRNVYSLPHTGTFRGNQIAFKLGKFFMEKYAEDKTEENVHTIEKFWMTQKETIEDNKNVKQFRVCGSLLGLELTSRDKCAKMFDRLIQNGLLVKKGGRNYQTLIFWCMLHLSIDALKEILSIMIKSLGEI